MEKKKLDVVNGAIGTAMKAIGKLQLVRLKHRQKYRKTLIQNPDVKGVRKLLKLRGCRVSRNIEACSRNRCCCCCCGKAISITYSAFVPVALVIQRVTLMRHIAICGLPRSTIFSPHYLINGRILERKLLYIKMCVDLLYIFV